MVRDEHTRQHVATKSEEERVGHAAASRWGFEGGNGDALEEQNALPHSEL